MPDRPTACPHCGGRVVPIAYGYPSNELMEAAERGEVRLGGCIVDRANPSWQCSECGASGGTLSFETSDSKRDDAP